MPNPGLKSGAEWLLSGFILPFSQMNRSGAMAGNQIATDSPVKSGAQRRDCLAVESGGRADGGA
jgi:hypothetical protein